MSPIIVPVHPVDVILPTREYDGMRVVQCCEGECLTLNPEVMNRHGRGSEVGKVRKASAFMSTGWHIDS